MATAQQTGFQIMRFEPIDQVTVIAHRYDAHLLSIALLAIGKSGGRVQRITSAVGGAAQTLAALFPAGSGSNVARRLRGKLRRCSGAQVVLERERSELRVITAQAPIQAARCVWALEDRGVIPTAFWIDSRGFGLVVERDASATAAAACYRVLGAGPLAPTAGAA